MDSGWNKNECLCKVEASKPKRPRVYEEKLPGLVIKEGHPPSRLSFIQSLYGENVNPGLLPESTVLSLHML